MPLKRVFGLSSKMQNAVITLRSNMFFRNKKLRSSNVNFGLFGRDFQKNGQFAGLTEKMTSRAASHTKPWPRLLCGFLVLSGWLLFGAQMHRRRMSTNGIPGRSLGWFLSLWDSFYRIHCGPSKAYFLQLAHETNIFLSQLDVRQAASTFVAEKTEGSKRLPENGRGNDLPRICFRKTRHCFKSAVTKWWKTIPSSNVARNPNGFFVG